MFDGPDEIYRSVKQAGIIVTRAAEKRQSLLAIPSALSIYSAII